MMVFKTRVLSSTPNLYFRRFSAEVKQPAYPVRQAHHTTPDLNPHLLRVQNLSVKVLRRSENLVRSSEEAELKKTEEKLSEKESKIKLLNYIYWLFKESKRKLKQELKQIEEQLDDETDLRLFKKVRYFLLQKTKSIL